jgi:hypothetical protein
MEEDKRINENEIKAFCRILNVRMNN